MRRIFAIGMNKTGTNSLHRAFGVLGLRSLHFAPDDVDPARGTVLSKRIRASISERIRAGDRDPLGEWGSYEAFSDIEPIKDHFDELHARYPGSRFIYTDRDAADWLDSREAHVRRNQVAAREGRYDGDWLSVDRAGWLAEKHAHAARVQDWFAVDGRSRDLLVFDVFRGDGYAELCDFLALPVPDEPFPWSNRTTAGAPPHDRHREDALRS